MEAHVIVLSSESSGQMFLQEYAHFCTQVYQIAASGGIVMDVRKAINFLLVTNKDGE